MRGRTAQPSFAGVGSLLIGLLAVMLVAGLLLLGRALAADEDYNLADGWYLTSSPIMTANWKADSGDKWTVPVGAGVGKLFKVGKLPINTSLQGYYNAEKPNSFSSDWQLRFQVQFLLPKF